MEYPHFYERSSSTERLFYVAIVNVPFTTNVCLHIVRRQKVLQKSMDVGAVLELRLGRGLSKLWLGGSVPHYLSSYMTL